MESTKQYDCLALGFDVNADFSDMSSFFRKNSWRIKFIKSMPLFFGHPCDSMKCCDMLGNDLKLWLIRLDEKYYVFLNCGIKRYDNYLAELEAYDSVLYDASYPVLRGFETEKEANGFYNNLSSLLSDTVIHESIIQKFNAKYFTQLREYDISLGRITEKFEHTIYRFNNSQNLSIVLQKHDSKTYESYSIIVNRRGRIAFKTENDRNACWDFLVSFYQKFEEKKVSGVSDQLFLTDFLMELMQNSDEVKNFKMKDGKAVFLDCYFMGYSITFRAITRNGRYWGKDFEFKTYDSEGGIGLGRITERFKMEYLKNYLREIFPNVEFLQKYINS